MCMMVRLASKQHPGEDPRGGGGEGALITGQSPVRDLE